MSFLVKLFKFVVLLTLLCAGAYFILFNGAAVELSFGHLGSISMPAAVIYIIFYLLGAFTITAYFGYEYTRRTLRLRKIERKLRNLESSSMSARSSDGDIRSQAPEYTL